MFHEFIYILYCYTIVLYMRATHIHTTVATVIFHIMDSQWFPGDIKEHKNCWCSVFTCLTIVSKYQRPEGTIMQFVASGYFYHYLNINTILSNITPTLTKLVSAVRDCAACACTAGRADPIAVPGRRYCVLCNCTQQTATQTSSKLMSVSDYDKTQITTRSFQNSAVTVHCISNY